MHIGVDARLVSSRLTGIGRYTLELSKKLIQMPNAQVSFYAPSDVSVEIEQFFKPFNIRCGFSQNRLSRMIWSQTTLPYWARGDGVDLFWGPTHRLPRFLPKSMARVVTIHDLVWKYAPQTMRPLSLLMEKRLMPEAIGLADLVMADSQSTASGIAEVFPEFSGKVRVVHLGISTLPSESNTSSLSKLGICKPYFLFIGTLEPRKNLERLLGAFAIAPQWYKDKFNLVIAGGKGWGCVDVEKLVSNNRLQDSVKVLGYVTDQQLGALYARAQFLAMPSLYEGFGLPLLEVMQYGVPVLISHGGALAEVAGDGGLHIDPYSVDSISTGIQRMLRDKKLIKTLSDNAFCRASDFSWDKCAAETMAVFEEAIALRDIRMYRS